MKKKSLFVVFLLCYLFGLVYRYIHIQNEITKLKFEIPRLVKQIQVIEQKNSLLQFKIDQFNNPLHLFELSREPSYSFLKYPLVKDVIELDANE